MRSVLFKTGTLGCAAGAAALLLTTSAAMAQFFPFFQQQPQRQAPPAPPVQQSRPSQPAQPAPAKKTQPPAQKASAPAQKAQPASPKAAPATAAAPYGEVRTACATEIRSTCAGVVPGSADSVQCLRRNFAAHMPPCQAALTRAGDVTVQPAAVPEKKPDAPVGTAEAPRRVSTDRITQPEAAASPAPDLKLPAMRPTQEARWVNRNCKEDHSLLCQGVTFGQSRVLKCLLSHQSSLKADCKKALAKR